MAQVAYREAERRDRLRFPSPDDHLGFGTRARVIVLASILCWTLLLGSVALALR